MKSEEELYAWADEVLRSSSPQELLGRVQQIVRENDEWRTKRCINLHAAESLMSPSANLLLQSDLGRRILLWNIGERVNRGTKYIDKLDALVTQLAKRIFKVDFVDYRPVTTSVADGIVIRSLTEIGDTILALEPPNGHSTWRQEGYAGYRGLKVVDVPFDYENWNIDTVGLRQVVQKLAVNPKLLIVGTPAFLFPHPVRELADIAAQTGTRLWYDGAHVLGLIATGEFQDPLGEGAYVLTGTGSKTLSGPMGGIILHNDPKLNIRMRAIVPGLQSTLGHNRTAALAATLIELSVFGQAYSRQMITNAKALAKYLDGEGFEIVGRKNGYTESHAVLMDTRSLGGGDKTTGLLEQGNVICSAYPLRKNDDRPEGVRLGVTEVTRLGMKEEEMAQIAFFMRRLVSGRERPEKIAEEVAEFRGRYTQTHFCF